MKKKMKKNKGFTLIELLAVIVILAVIMLIATTSIQSVMLDARKGAFRNEFLSLLESANIQVSLDSMNGKNDMNKANASTCYSLSKITQFSKSTDDNYKGSVLVTKTAGVTTIEAWMSNGEFVITKQKDNLGTDAVTASNDSAATDCGGTGKPAT